MAKVRVQLVSSWSGYRLRRAPNRNPVRAFELRTRPALSREQLVLTQQNPPYKNSLRRVRDTAKRKARVTNCVCKDSHRSVHARYISVIRVRAPRSCTLHPRVESGCRSTHPSPIPPARHTHPQPSRILLSHPRTIPPRPPPTTARYHYGVPMASRRGPRARTLCPLHQAVSVRVMRAPREVRALEAGAWRRVPPRKGKIVVVFLHRRKPPAAPRRDV